MYDVDPKWADQVKERGSLPPPAHDLPKRLSSTSSSSMKTKSRSSSSAPSPSPQNIPTSQSIPTSLASGLQFPGLGGLPPSLLSGLSGLGNYDPKTNPLLLPFGGMPNLSALGGLGNMNLSNSLFANLAGLGLPGLGGMDPQALAEAAAGGQSSKSKNRKSSGADLGGKNPPTSTASSMASQLPFFFPNPSLLYTPLGLGGLNPFPLPPGAMPSAYESLLLNGGLPTTSSTAATRQRSSTTTSRSSTVTTPSRSPYGDSHLLDSLTRASLQPPPRGSRTSQDSLKSLMSAIPPFMGDHTASSSSSGKKSREQVSTR